MCIKHKLHFACAFEGFAGFSRDLDGTQGKEMQSQGTIFGNHLTFLTKLFCLCMLKTITRCPTRSGASRAPWSQPHPRSTSSGVLRRTIGASSGSNRGLAAHSCAALPTALAAAGCSLLLAAACCSQRLLLAASGCTQLSPTAVLRQLASPAWPTGLPFGGRGQLGHRL